jgi:hypothetical protein
VSQDAAVPRGEIEQLGQIGNQVVVLIEGTYPGDAAPSIWQISILGHDTLPRAITKPGTSEGDRQFVFGSRTEALDALNHWLQESGLTLEPPPHPPPSSLTADVATVPPIFIDGWGTIPSYHPVWAVVDAIHNAGDSGAWTDHDGLSAPTHTTSTNKGNGAVYVSVRGPDGEAHPNPDMLPALWERVRSMDDLTSDAFLACLAQLAHASNPNEPVWITAKAILEARGIKPKRNLGEHWNHGHRKEDLMEAGRAIFQLEHLWLQLANVEVIPEKKGRRKGHRITHESRALAMTDQVKQEGIDGPSVFLGARVAFGSWMNQYTALELRQTALIAQRSLEYDPYHQQVEKRLAKYFAFQLRINDKARGQRTIRRVDTLLDAATMRVDANNPARTRERLERALSVLRDDGVIRQWSYARDPQDLPTKRWVPEWLTRTILIEPCETVSSQYGLIERKSPSKQLSPVEAK